MPWGATVITSPAEAKPSPATSPPVSTARTTGLKLLGPGRVGKGLAAETTAPSLTSAAAWRRLAGVIRFSAPRWSSAPQRPQFFSSSNIVLNSAVLTARTLEATISLHPASVYQNAPVSCADSGYALPPRPLGAFPSIQTCRQLLPPQLSIW